MKFENILGHQEICQKISNLISLQRLPHALLIQASEGTGGLPLALAIAQKLVCENSTANVQNEGENLEREKSVFLNDSCGVCSACIKSSKFIHPDIHFTFPTIRAEGQKTPPISADYIKEWRQALTENPYLNYNQWLAYMTSDNKQGNITVNECHEIIKGMTLTAFESNYKIQIIWFAEYLREAGNTLLKIIEEPPAKTIFILVVENMDLVLNTILSRTQLVKLPMIEDVALAKVLSDRFEMETDAALRIARIADGNFNLALEFAIGAEQPSDVIFQNWMSICIRLKSPKHAGEGAEKLLNFIEEISKSGRENQKIFIKYCLWFLREVNLISLGLVSEKLSGSELDFAKKLAPLLVPEIADNLVQILNELHYHVERNGNSKILFTSSTIKLVEALKGEYVALIN